MDAQRALSRTAQAQLRQLTDMLQKDEKMIQELKNELADRKEELNAANRKLHTLREDGFASQASLPLPVRCLPRNQPRDEDLEDPHNTDPSSFGANLRHCDGSLIHVKNSVSNSHVQLLQLH